MPSLSWLKLFMIIKRINSSFPRFTSEALKRKVLIEPVAKIINRYSEIIVGKWLNVQGDTIYCWFEKTNPLQPLSFFQVNVIVNSSSLKEFIEAKI